MWRTAITFRTYLKQLVKFGVSSSLALGIIIAIALLAGGGTTTDIEFNVEFGAFDGVWFVIGLPALTVLICLILSPLSFGIHKLPSIRRHDSPLGDE